MADDSTHSVVFLGDSAVGKTSIIQQYLFNALNPDHKPSIGIDFFSQEVTFPDSNPPKTIKMRIWDTAGQEKFRSIIPSYIRTSTVTVIVFDITSMASFNNVSQWHETALSIADPRVSFILVGNKADLEVDREVPTEKAESYASSIHAKYIETSARTPINIDELFQLIIRCPLLDESNNSNTKNDHQSNGIQIEKINIAQNTTRNDSTGGCSC